MRSFLNFRFGFDSQRGYFFKKQVTMKKITLIFAILTVSFAANAQKIGDWITHTPGMNVISVDIMNENVFAATPYDIFYYNTNDNSINRLSKVNGLSDMGISIIRYAKTKDVLFVGYTNTNIDIIDNQGNVTNIPDIYNKYILGNKTINNVYFKGKLAYVCCGFGIVVIDMNRKEVRDTYYFHTGNNYLGVNDLTICDGVFYAATERGIYYARTDNTHLADFSQWTQFRHHLPYTDENFSHIEKFDGYVVTIHSDNQNNNDELFAINDTTSWEQFFEWPQRIISDMRAYSNILVITEKGSRVKAFNKDKQRIRIFEGFEANSAIFDTDKKCYWIGSKSRSLVRIEPDGTFEEIAFNGPYSSNAFSINAVGNDIWVAAGGYRSTWAKTYNHDGFSHFDGDSWEYFNYKNGNLPDSLADITDFVCVKPDPRNKNIVYAATYDNGLLVFENGVFKNIYSYYNSSLDKHLSIDYTYLTGFDFDSKNNMWIANTGTGKMLSIWKNDGTWEAYNIGNQDIGDIMVDKNDIGWIYVRGGEITVFNGNMYKSVSKSANYGALPGDANCFATDNTGTVWVGTTDGVGLFYNTKKIFNSSTYACSRILIPRNDGSGQADYLLSGLSVLAIAVDGANNLWFGTNNGAIMTSNDGQTTYHHFTMENSPLFSNTVTDIAIDDNGIVYFATDKGIVAYKGTATKGGETNSDVVVYPNPVRPEHRGIVGIKGLVSNALVKITTTNGTFVTHLQAQGGQAVWDCTDINGAKVQPGIYLIFVSDETGQETFATKVLIMK